MGAARPFQMLPARAFGAIYADPPWQFETWSDAGLGRSERRHYRTMPTPEIAALPVGSLAYPKASTLLLWARSPMLPDALQVMGAWGFTFKTVAFVWVKQNPSGQGLHMGLGRWTRANAEFVLLGTRGQPRRRYGDVPQIVVAPRREHSRKPDEMRGLIERLTDGPYVELFCRARPSRRWAAWGSEVGKF